MIKIRNSVFETNSSSSHSITITDKQLEPNQMQMDEDGYIVVPLQEFSNHAVYTSQLERLALILQIVAKEIGVYLYNFWGYEKQEKAFEKIYDSEKFQDISYEIASYVGNGCKGIKLEGEGYLDDDGMYDCIEMFYLLNNTDLIEFVFGSNVIVAFEYNG